MELKEPRTRELKEDSFKRLELGKVPKEWAEVTLFTAAGSRKDRFDDGDWVEAEFITDKGVRLIQTGNIGSGQFLEKADKKYVSEASFQLLGCKEIRPGDLLISRLAAPAGRACVMPDIGEKKMITSVDVTIVRPAETIAVSEYLNQLFLTREWFEAVALRCGGTTHSRIPRSELGKIVLPLPKPEEQRAIATALSDVDGLMAGLDALIAKKKALKQGAMQQLLTGKQRLPGFKGEWVVRKLGAFADMSSGGTPLSNVPEYYGGHIPWVSIADMTNRGKYITDTDRKLTDKGLASSAARIYPARTLLYAMYASLGECSIALVQVSSSQAILGIQPRKGLDLEYLYFQLLARRDQVKTMGQQGTQSNLNKAMVQDFDIPMPPVEEQTAIAEVLSDMDAELGALEARRAKTALLKQGMMQELLTGRVRLV